MHRTNHRFRHLLFIAGMIFSAGAFADPTTAPVSILFIRPYNNSATAGAAYIQVDQTSVCDTNVYRVNFALNNSKEVYAAALAAFLANRKVKIEVVNTGCTGWGTDIQSIFVVN